MTDCSRLFLSFIFIFSSFGALASVQSDGYKHYIFFVHGYVGDDAMVPARGEVNHNHDIWFDSLLNGQPLTGIGNHLNNGHLARYTNSGTREDMTFSYLDRFSEVNMGLTEAHFTLTNPWGIETFSANLLQKITNVLIADSDYSTPKKVDIIGHSMGGVIATHMVLNYRDILYWYGAEFNSVVTLGSPHLGTPPGTLCDGFGKPSCSQLLFNENTGAWETHQNLVALQLVAGSDFMQNRMHGNATSYNYEGINWLFTAHPNDELVPRSSALALGVDSVAGVAFEREEIELSITNLNHLIVSGVRFVSCSGGGCDLIDDYRDSIRSFLINNF